MIDPLQPPIKVTEHDMLQVSMVEHMSRALGMALTLAAVHSLPEYRLGLIRTARELARTIDAQAWESQALRDWWCHEKQTPWVQRIVAKINEDDIEGIQKLAQQMQYEHPLPRLVVE